MTDVFKEITCRSLGFLYFLFLFFVSFLLILVSVFYLFWFFFCFQPLELQQSVTEWGLQCVGDLTFMLETVKLCERSCFRMLVCRNSNTATCTLIRSNTAETLTWQVTFTSHRKTCFHCWYNNTRMAMVHSGGVGECSGGHLDFDNSCAYTLCIYERSTR